MTKHIMATAGAALALLTAPALAGTTESRSQTISVEGLDLSTPAGQRLLDQRIERAARSVCQSERTRTGTRMQSRAARDCLKIARASARKQVAAMIESRRQGG